MELVNRDKKERKLAGWEVRQSWQCREMTKNRGSFLKEAEQRRIQDEYRGAVVCMLTRPCPSWRNGLFGADEFRGLSQGRTSQRDDGKSQ